MSQNKYIIIEDKYEGNSKSKGNFFYSTKGTQEQIYCHFSM